jgi:hypothetical protein
MIMANVIEVLSNEIEDVLPKVVQDRFRKIDPVYNYILQSATAAIDENSAGMGYKYKVNHLFGGGVSGVFKGVSPYGPGAVASGAGRRYGTFLDGNGTTPFPNALNSPHLAVAKRSLTLHRSTGNFNIPAEWLQSDNLSAANIKQVGRNIMAVGKHRAHREAVSLFCSRLKGATSSHFENATFSVLAKVSSVADSDTNTTKTIAIKDGRIMYFLPNMMVQFVNPATATAAALFKGAEIGTSAVDATTFVVTDVDYMGGTIKIAHVGANYGQAMNAVEALAAIAEDDWIIEADPYIVDVGTNDYYVAPMVTWGFDDWIKSSGVLFNTSTGAEDGLSLSQYPTFKSHVVSVGGALTDSVINAKIGGFVDAYGEGAPDSMITTWGVILKYLESPNASGLDRMSFDRTGKSLDVKGGFNEVKYNFNGTEVKILISSMCQSGTAYGIKTSDGNIKRYVPPRAAKIDGGGGTADERIGAEVQFLAKILGGSIFKHAVGANGESTNIFEAPLWHDKLVAPEDVRSVKLTNITEATLG